MGTPTSSFGVPIWPVHKIDDSWSMTVNDDKFNQGMTPFAAVPDVIPLLEQINTPSDSWLQQLLIWQLVFFSSSPLFLIFISKEHQKQFIWQGQQYTFHFPTSEVNWFSSPML